MHRRGVLAALGASIGVFGGCLETGRLAGTRTGSATEPSASDTATPAFDPDGRTETIRIGTNPGEIVPHGVSVWNALGSSIRVAVRVLDTSTGDTVHEKTHELPADVALAITLREPSRYEIRVRVPELDSQRTVSVPERLFDTCNDSYTHVSIRENGITERTMTTELACTTATENESSVQDSHAGR